MSLESETKKAHTTTRKVPDTVWERLRVMVSPYRQASIAVIAVVLLICFQIGTDGQFLSAQLLGVVLSGAMAQDLLAGSYDVCTSGVPFSLPPVFEFKTSLGSEIISSTTDFDARARSVAF
jgi:hypothetical protein